MAARANATSPWIVDIPLTPDADGKWTNKFMQDHVDEVENVTWVANDGIRYLLPEIVLCLQGTPPAGEGRTRLRSHAADAHCRRPNLYAEVT